MKNFLILFFLSLALYGCGQGLMGGNQKENMEKLDKVYGKCNNPHRIFSPQEKKVCEDQQRAAGPDGVVGDPINITEILDNIKNGGERVVYAGSKVNDYLWNGSLGVVENYSLKTVDSQGGFISTEWILNPNLENKRCLIKINVLSQELISTGVKTKIICENQVDGQWYNDNAQYINEEKNLTLKILELANELSKLEATS